MDEGWLLGPHQRSLQQINRLLVLTLEHGHTCLQIILGQKQNKAVGTVHCSQQEGSGFEPGTVHGMSLCGEGASVCCRIQSGINIEKLVLWCWKRNFGQLSIKGEQSILVVELSTSSWPSYGYWKSLGTSDYMCLGTFPFVSFGMLWGYLVLRLLLKAIQWVLGSAKLCTVSSSVCDLSGIRTENQASRWIRWYRIWSGCLWTLEELFTPSDLGMFCWELKDVSGEKDFLTTQFSLMPYRPRPRLNG